MRKCVICDVRPVKGNGYCAHCNQQLEAGRKRKANEQPTKFLTYRGYVVGLFPNGDGTLKARLLKRSPKNLSKRKTLDLNTYLEGFTREQIKNFKRCVLQLANA